MWNARNTWLSGMSPAAADCASATSAPAPEDVGAVPAEPPLLPAGAVVGDVLAAGELDPDDPPHPAATQTSNPAAMVMYR